MPVYVTAEALGAIVGPAAPAERVQLAVDAANRLIPQWVEVDAGDPTAEPPVPPSDPPEDDPALRQGALELAHELYRSQVAVGGVFSVDDMLSRLPADRVRPIRDLLDAAAHRWGLA